MQEKTRTAPGDLRIIPRFTPLDRSAESLEYSSEGLRRIAQLLPENVDPNCFEEVFSWCESHVPFLRCSKPDHLPTHVKVSVLLSSANTVDPERVVLDILSKWAFPEKELRIGRFYQIHFFFEEKEDTPFFFAEYEFLVDTWKELGELSERIPLLRDDLGLCMSSPKYFSEILDTRAMRGDQKSSQIQQQLRKIHRRFPQEFGVDLFKEMSLFFALSNKNFHKFRLPKHLAKVIFSHYAMGRSLRHQFSLNPKNRHLKIHFMPTRLFFPFGSKRVLGISIAVGLASKHEAFDATHVVAAVQKFYPNLQIVKGSYYFYRPNHQAIKFMYLELENREGYPVSFAELSHLKQVLVPELKNRIEKLTPFVFIKRNEEEVMRNILLLSQELKLVSDLPQVMINLDQQQSEEVSFTVVVARILKKGALPIKEAFSHLRPPIRFTLDRAQTLGYVRKKHLKEASVFHLCLPKETSILRTDSSVNFYLARQKVIDILKRGLGEFRDYNGGMILKQGELFSRVKEVFCEVADYKQELIEDFFFSLSPIEAQATTHFGSLVALFQLLLNSISETLKHRESYHLKFERGKDKVFAALRVKESSAAEYLDQELSKLHIVSKQLVKTHSFYQGAYLYGYIYETENPQLQKLFEAALEQAAKRYSETIRHLQELRLSFFNLPSSLDPRTGGDEMTSSLMKMLFEGLTRISSEGVPELAIAESFEISADKKHYLFKLRESYWSNGAALSAYDFEYSWKKLLSPEFKTPFTYFLFHIKNASAAKNGELSLDEVGIKAIDELTLSIHLEYPVPEFLEFLAHTLYSPINREVEQLHPNWPQSTGQGYVCNGPFKLDRILENGKLILVKNPLYWNRDAVTLKTITIGVDEIHTAQQLYRSGEIDCIGRPLQPYLGENQSTDEDVLSQAIYGNIWCNFNTQKFPFSNAKIRRAFSLCLNRKKIVDQIGEGLLPAVSPLPIKHTFIDHTNLLEGDQAAAIELFEQGLKELGVRREDIPMLTYFSPETLVVPSQEAIDQWEAVLGIRCQLESYDFDTVFSKMLEQDFMIAAVYWRSWIDNPAYTLNTLEYKAGAVNFSNWENNDYHTSLHLAKEAVEIDERNAHFAQAEQILCEESPVISLAASPAVFRYKRYVNQIVVSQTGNVDFKSTQIVPT